MEKRFSKACERNKEPILDVLGDYVDGVESIFEIGCGTGQHAVFLAEQFPEIVWRPADRPGRLESMRARFDESDLDNLQEPVEFDLFDESAPVEHLDAVVAINVLQIAPPEAIPKLFEHAAAITPDDGLIYLYGPYRYRDRPLEPSNRQFHEHLQSKAPHMGIPLFEDVEEAANTHGFELVEDREMPANNRSLVWSK